MNSTARSTSKDPAQSFSAPGPRSPSSAILFLLVPSLRKEHASEQLRESGFESGLLQESGHAEMRLLDQHHEVLQVLPRVRVQRAQRRIFVFWPGQVVFAKTGETGDRDGRTNGRVGHPKLVEPPDDCLLEGVFGRRHLRPPSATSSSSSRSCSSGCSGSNTVLVVVVLVSMSGSAVGFRLVLRAVAFTFTTCTAPPQSSASDLCQSSGLFGVGRCGDCSHNENSRGCTARRTRPSARPS